MRRNVMIFSGGSYPGIEIYFALKDSVVFKPIMASSYSDHSRFVAFDYLSDMPYTYDDDFVDRLNEQIKKNNIEFIIPTHDTIAKVLMDNEKSINAVIVCSPSETADMCRSKKKTYERLKNKRYVPIVYSEFNKLIEFPLFAKPDDGQGSQGAVRIEDNESLLRNISDERMIVTEFLPGKEYTVDCFTDSEGNLLFINPRLRSRIQYGISARAESVDDDRFISIAQDINKEIRFRGYWFIQLKEDANGNLKLLELCTRFSGTFNHSQGLGVNLPLLAVSDFAGMKVSVVKNNYSLISDKTFIDRYEIDYPYQRVYIDYDDTITCCGGQKTNWMIMGYLYQCKNKGIKIELITRHSVSKPNSLKDDMNKLAIPATLFDDIIELEWNDKKADCLDNSIPSIFIDNSFSERAEVSEKVGMPVFDVNNILCLYDWRQ